MSSKAAKRRQKKGQSKMAMYDSFRAEAGSVEATVQRKPKEDPRVVVLAARRKAGATDTDDAQRPMWGEPAGQALRLGSADQDEADRLWSTFKRIDRADDAYARRFTGIMRFPNVSKMEFLPESFETRHDDRPDARTPDEKDRDAVSDWMRWQGLLGCIGRDNHTAIVDAMRQRVRLVDAGRVTRAGAAFVSAMRALDDQYQRR